jgi:hypothetical protein
LSCGTYDLKDTPNGEKMYSSSRERYHETIRNYSEHRHKWIEKSYNCLNNCGCGGRPKKIRRIEEVKERADPQGIKLNIKTFDYINRKASNEIHIRGFDNVNPADITTANLNMSVNQTIVNNNDSMVQPEMPGLQEQKEKLSKKETWKDKARKRSHSEKHIPTIKSFDKI